MTTAAMALTPRPLTPQAAKQRVEDFLRASAPFHRIMLEAYNLGAQPRLMMQSDGQLSSMAPAWRPEWKAIYDEAARQIEELKERMLC